MLTAAKTTTILLVDDVAFHLETERTFLRRRDVKVLTSGQGPHPVTSPLPSNVAVWLKAPGRGTTRPRERNPHE